MAVGSVEVPFLKPCKFVNIQPGGGGGGWRGHDENKLIIESLELVVLFPTFLFFCCILF